MLSEQFSIQNIHNSKLPIFSKEKSKHGSSKKRKLTPQQKLAEDIENFVTREMYVSTPMNELNPKVISTLDKLPAYCPT
jgi:hypothetical protein